MCMKVAEVQKAPTSTRGFNSIIKLLAANPGVRVTTCSWIRHRDSAHSARRGWNRNRWIDGRTDTWGFETNGNGFLIECTIKCEMHFTGQNKGQHIKWNKVTPCESSLVVCILLHFLHEQPPPKKIKYFNLERKATIYLPDRPSWKSI